MGDLAHLVILLVGWQGRNLCVPKRRVWSQQWYMSSILLIPWGKLQKFSTSEVVVSWPPRVMPLAIEPSKEMGLSSMWRHLYGGGVGGWAAYDYA